MKAPASTSARQSAIVAGVLAVAVIAAVAGIVSALRGEPGTAAIAVVVLAGVAVAGLLLGRAEARRHARSLAEHTAMLEQLAADLARANRAKGEFLANVSHELRTPLAAIVGFVEMLRDGAYGELTPRQVGPVERIETSANHLRELVDDILDLSKLAAARKEVHREPIALRPFVLDVASEIEPLVQEKGLALSIAVGTTLPRLRTDPAHLRQILVNLLGNSVKYTERGSISIRARMIDASGSEAQRAQLPERLPAAHGVWIAMSVHDTGIGIGPENQERVFDEFEQVNAGPRGDSIRRGTGLGLSISRRLVQLLGGDISLESEPGKGSTFTLWLPVDPRDLAPNATSASAIRTTP